MLWIYIWEFMPRFKNKKSANKKGLALAAAKVRRESRIR